jgi:thioredoxin-related protein
MKKQLKLVVLAMTALAVLASCSKPKNKARKPSENIDSTTWIDNLIDGKAAAVKENKKIFIFFSGDDQDGASAGLKEKVFNTEEFIRVYTDKYVLVNLDFSDSKFEAAKADPLASDEEKKVAGELEKRLEENLRDASLYNIEATPTFYILTKEGYVVKEVIFEKPVSSVEEVNAVFEGFEDEIAVYDNTLSSAVNSPDKKDRLEAIDKLFELTDPQHRYLLVDLSGLYVKLDKKNETGNVGKHIVAIANANAVQAYLDQDPAAASDQFANAAKSRYLSSVEKQQCYYTAGYLYGQSAPNDFKKIKSYFEKSYNADPESQYAEQIQNMVKMLEERIAESEAQAEQVEPETEPEAPAQEGAEAPAEAAEAPAETSEAAQN